MARLIDEQQLRAAFDGQMPAVYFPSAFVRGCCFACALMCAAGALGIAAWFVLIEAAPELWAAAFALAGMIGCVAGAVLLTLGGFRWATALTDRRIGTIGIFKVRTMARRDLAGFRENPTQYGLRSVRAFSKVAGVKPLMIALYRPDARLLEWFFDLPDLNRIDLEAAADALLARQDLGATPAERAARLHRFKRIAAFADLGGYALALWGFIAPTPYGLVIALLAAAPVAGFALIVWSRGAIAIDPNTADPRPGLAGLFFMAPMMLGLRALLDCQVVDWRGVVIAAVVAAAAAGIVFAWRKSNAGPRAKLGAGIGAAFVAALLTWGAVVEADVMLDSSPAQKFRPMILDKTVSQGSRHTSYKLKLEPWGPYPEAAEVDAPHWVYDAVEVGVPACIRLHGGALGVRWFSVRPC